MFDRKNVENIYNLSPMQEGILFHSIKDQESHVYFQQASVRIDTNLNQEILNRSFQQLIQKYSILRTLFIYQKVERPLQIVLKERKTNIFFEDISHLSAEEQQEYIKSYQENDKKQGFDLTRDLLFRLAVIQKNKDSFLLIWSFHHILMDGWCIGILIDDFFQFYKQNCSKKDGLAIQEKEKYPYVTYIKWLEKQKKEAAIAYWQEYLKGYAEEASLPKKITSSTETEYIQKNRFMELSPEKTKELQRIAQKYGVTLNILIQSVWGVLLQKYNLKEDVVFGSVVSGRPSQIEGIESMIGLFINTVPVRVRSKANMIFSELMREVQNGFLSSEPYQYLSLTEIQNQSVVKQKLFDHIIVFENFPIGSGQQSAEAQEETFTFKEVEVFEQTNYDFNFVVFPGEELKIEWSYNAAVYDEEWVSRMSEQWRNLLDQILDQPEIEIGELVLATQEECSKLEMWNRTEKAELANTTIHEWVEKQALQAPSEVAAFFDGSIMTYQELHEKSNQVAWRLRKEGVRPQEAIGLMVEPSFQMLIGMLGILKAGGAYVPLDPRLPEQRIWFMLEDTKARFVLSQTPLLSSFKECDQQIRWIDLQDSSLYTGEAISIPNVNSSHDLAYIMYTSGSTGQPKGVMVEHRNIVNLSSWFADIYDLSRHKNILQMTNLSFDVSVEETLVPLMHGAKVIIPTREVLWNSEDFGTFLREQEIQIAQFVPATLKNLLLKTEKIDSLQVVICGGEALDINTAKRVAAMGYSLYNHYGPTETTVDVLTYPYQESATPVYIGKPIYNVQAYILDHHHKQVGIGVPGELWISGAGVSRGYVNHEERTAESFIPAPLGKGNMYRTGDLACIHPDGNIEYLGRIDQQVKIRGQRIELGEILAQLKEHPSIEDAVVTIYQDDRLNKFLVAYYVLKSANVEANLTDIREFLSMTLPDYMVPSYYIQMESLPLNHNGKIDLAKLPTPSGKMDTGKSYVAPASEMEEALAQVWQEVLGVDQVSMDDHYFDLGGDSIKALQIVSRLHKKNIKLDLKALFKYPVLRELSAQIEKAGVEKEGALQKTQGMISGQAPLTPIQHWFFEQQFTDAHHWNQGVMFKSREALHEAYLHKVFTKLLVHHDALRMTYSEEGEIQQFNQGLNHIGYTLEVVDCRQEPSSQGQSEEQERMYLEHEATRLQESINLQKGPLVRVGLFRTLEADYLLVAVHHLVVDAVSWRILLEDLNQAYLQAKQGEEILFQDKTTSYKEWAEKLVHYANSPATLRYLPYWKQVESSTVIPLPKASTVENLQMLDSERYELEWSQEETEQLLRAVHQAYRTQTQDVLLSALVLTLYEWTKQPHVAVQLEGHGREALFEDVDLYRTVGWFTTQYPVVFHLPITDQDEEKAQEATSQREVNLELHLGELLKTVKERLRQIPEKGIHYGLLRYLTEEKHKAGVSFELDPEINFNYLGEFSESATSQTGEQADAGAILEMSSLPTGAQVSPRVERTHVLDINALVMQGKLHMMWNVHPQEIDRQTMDWLLQAYRANLQQLMSHCLSKQETERTPSDVGCTDVSLSEWKEIQQQLPDSKIEKLYALSPMQEGMFFHYLYDRQTTMYIEQTVLTLEGELNLEYFRQSLQHLSQRHDVCRTAFLYEGLTKPMQAVLADREIAFHYEEMKELTQQKVTEYVEAYRQQEQVRGFDLLHDPLIRVAVLAESRERYHVLWTFHHILMDGWCMGIIMNDFFQFYKDQKMNRPLTVVQAPAFSDYIDWLHQQDKSGALSYWEKKLASFEQISVLPKKQSTVESHAEFKQEEVSLNIDFAITDQIRRYCQRNKVTMNTFIQSVWAILLQRYNRVEDVVFGSVVSGRPSTVKGIEEMVGLFINTIPTRIQSSSTISVKELLQQVQQAALEDQAHDYVSLAEIQSQTLLKQDLFDHIMIFENYPLVEKMKKMSVDPEIDLAITQSESYERTNYSLNIVVVPGDSVTIHFHYNQADYDRARIEKVSQHFQHLLLQIVNSAETRDLKVSELELITPEEQKELLRWSTQVGSYSRENTIHEMFEKQAQTTPNKIALSCNQVQLSYAEVNAKANQWARVLRDKGVGTDHIIGIMLPRSLEMGIGLLAILKAGGAYLPIDPSYPKERIEYYLKDSGVDLLLTLPYLMEDLKFTGTWIDVSAERIESYSTENVEVINQANDLAYVIYTSGSTGEPKGVMIEHKSVVNYVQWRREQYGIQPDDVALQLISYAFDGYGSNYYSALLTGGKLVLVTEEEHVNFRSIVDTIRQEKVTHMSLVPAMYKEILAIGSMEDLRTLRFVVLAGESSEAALIEQSREKAPHILLINEYGPTENCIATSAHLGMSADEHAIIGKPVYHHELYVLDPQLSFVPSGVPGELYVGGAGLARGYLHRPEQTSEAFISHPFKPNERLYKTGDLVTWLDDGSLKYLGRVDQQLKINGHRIELGEIENHINRYEAIQDSVVIAHEDPILSVKRLSAFIMMKEPCDTRELQAYLKKQLPYYMIPTRYLEIEQLPLTPTGKVDRALLAQWAMEQQQEATTYIDPRTEQEEIMAAVWKEVLGIEKISVEQNYFELGGDSIKAVQIVARLSKYKWKLEVKDLFEQPTLEEASTMLKRITASISQESVTGEVLLTPIQQWFFEQTFSEQHHWNQAMMLYSPKGFKPEFVHKAFEKITEQHDALRMSYIQTDEGIKQINNGLEGTYFSLESYDLIDENEELLRKIENEVNQLHRRFDLERGPLVQLGLFRTREGDHLLIIVHHLIIDGISWRILLEDFQMGYEQLLKKEEITLPEKTHSYQEWAKRLSHLAQDARFLEKEISYWKGIETTVVQPLPKEQQIESRKWVECNTIQIEWTKELTHHFVHSAHKTYQTNMNDLLLVALGLAFKAWTGQEQLAVQLEGHGREDLIPDTNISRTMGWFTSFYPVLLNIDTTQDLSYVIKSTKEMLRRIPNKGAGYGIVKYLTPKQIIEEKQLSFHLQPEVNFNYLGQFDEGNKETGITFSSLSSGIPVGANSEKTYPLDVSGMIVNGRLEFTFTFHHKEFNIQTIQTLAHSFKENLVNMIEHCCSKTETEITPSDLGDKELSLEELDDISEMLMEL